MSTGSITRDELEAIVNDGRCEEAVDDLVASLAMADDESNAFTVDAIRAIESLTVEQATRLLPLTQHDSPPVAAWACKMLTRCIPPDGRLKTAREEMITKTLNEHASVSTRQDAAKALGDLQGIGEIGIAALEAAAQSDDPRLTRIAQQTLSKYGGG